MRKFLKTLCASKGHTLIESLISLAIFSLISLFTMNIFSNLLTGIQKQKTDILESKKHQFFHRKHNDKFSFLKTDPPPAGELKTGDGFYRQTDNRPHIIMLAAAKDSTLFEYVE